MAAVRRPDGSIPCVAPEAEGHDQREINLVLDFCLKVGEMLLSSGAGAADVSVTMRALAHHFGLGQQEVDVTFTSLSMSFQPDPESADDRGDPAGQAA